jgi:hypothetical protein
MLDFVDGKTNGKAGQFQCILSYLLFGGLAALVNLLVFGLVLYRFHFTMSVSTQVHNIPAFTIAAECSIIASFLPNDRFTFMSLPGAKRPWLTISLPIGASNSPDLWYGRASLLGTHLPRMQGWKENAGAKVCARNNQFIHPV